MGWTAQSGGGESLVNATQLQGVGISATSPTNGQVLEYNSTSGLWVPATPSSGGSGDLVKISTQTLSSAASSISFTSIPSSYTNLKLLGTLNGSVDDVRIFLQFNSDTGSNYNYSLCIGGNSTFNESDSAQSQITLGFINTSSTSIPSNIDTTIFNYTNSNWYKGLTSLCNIGPSNNVSMTNGVWLNTTTISSVAIFLQSGNLLANSTFTLYGLN